MQCTWQAALHKAEAAHKHYPTFTPSSNGTWKVHVFLWFVAYLQSYCCVLSILYLTHVSSLVRVLDGGQQQCVNPGHARVRLNPSAIHWCFAFLLVSLLPLPPFKFFFVSFKMPLQLFKAGSSSCSSSQPSAEKKTCWKTATTCSSRSYLQCRSPL